LKPSASLEKPLLVDRKKSLSLLQHFLFLCFLPWSFSGEIGCSLLLSPSRDPEELEPQFPGDSVSVPPLVQSLDFISNPYFQSFDLPFPLSLPLVAELWLHPCIERPPFLQLFYSAVHNSLKQLICPSLLPLSAPPLSSPDWV